MGTPTEGGAIGAFIVFLMALYRGMGFKQLKDFTGDWEANNYDIYNNMGCFDLC